MQPMSHKPTIYQPKMMCLLSIIHFIVDPRTFLAIEKHLRLIEAVEQASGLNVNHQKQEIIGIKPDHEEAKLKANIFNCGQWPNIYVGLPLSGKEYYGFLDSYHSSEKMKEDSSLGVIDILLRGSIYSSTSYSHKSQTFTSPLTICLSSKIHQKW